MLQTKTTIRKLIGEGELENAAAAAVQYAEHCGLTDLVNALIGIQSRQSEHRQQWEAGQITYENYSIAHAKITADLTAWTSRLPDQPVAGKKGAKMLTEAKFRQQLFYWMCAVKTVVVIGVIYLWSTGGFTVDEFIATLTLLTPSLVAYLKVMVEGFSNEHRQGLAAPRYVSGPLVPLSYFLLLAYPFAILLCLVLKVQGTLTFAYMNACLVLAESALGALLSKVVNTFFKTEN